MCAKPRQLSWLRSSSSSTSRSSSELVSGVSNLKGADLASQQERFLSPLQASIQPCLCEHRHITNISNHTSASMFSRSFSAFVSAVPISS